jgi:hypothetical protein
MAARWVGLSRPSKKKKAARAVSRHGFAQAVRDSLHAFGATSVLIMAAVMNFALYPDALAAVVGGDQAALVGFVPVEPSGALAPAPATPVVVNEADVRLLAATAWGEARSEGADGMRAVAHVIVNRVGQRFGDSVETVIRAPKQFSAWNIGDPNRPLVQNPERYATGGANLETWRQAQEIARQVLSGQSVDPTNGALFYHTRAIRPWWSRYGQGRTVIGAHVFYRDVPDQSRSARRHGRLTQVADVSPRRLGPRAGRVRGVIQHAPLPETVQQLPAPTAIAVEAEPITASPSDLVTTLQ